MLKEVGDYEIVDVTGLEPFIKGRIMPARMAGAKRAKRYEDYLFLLEGLYERLDWKGHSGPKVKSRMSRWSGYEAFYWNSVAEAKITAGGVRIGERSLHDFCDAEQELPSSAFTIDTPNWKETIIAQVAANAPEIEEVTFKVGEVLKKEEAEKAFRNLTKLTRTYIWYGSITTGGRHRIHSQGAFVDFDAEPETVLRPYDEMSEWLEGADNIYFFSSTDDWERPTWGGTQWNSTCHEYEHVMVEDGRFAHAKAAKALVVAETILCDNGGEGGEYRNRSFMDVFPQDVMVKKDAEGKSVLDFTSINLDTLAGAALSRHGRTKHSGPEHLETYSEDRVTCEGAWVIIDHEFPATPEDSETN